MTQTLCSMHGSISSGPPSDKGGPFFDRDACHRIAVGCMAGCDAARMGREPGWVPNAAK